MGARETDQCTGADQFADQTGRLRRFGRTIGLRKVHYSQIGHRASQGDDGYVYVAGREVGAEPVRVGMAFQNPTMLPWLTVRDNVMMPLKIVPPFRQEYRAKYKTEFRDRADALLKEVGLANFGDKHPWQLSGGMLQRASLCRALVHEPQLLMLDEPLARSINSPARSCGRSCRNCG